MAIIFCDSGTGSDSDDGSTWALAKATLQAAITAAGAGGTVYLADTHSETPGTVTYTCPAGTGNEPVVVISSDVLTGTSVSYKEPTSYQIASTGNVSFDGSIVCVGIWASTTGRFYIKGASGEFLKFSGCKLSLGSGVDFSCDSITSFSLIDCEVVINDSSSTTNQVFAINSRSAFLMSGCSFSGTLTNRTSQIIEVLNTATDVKVKIIGTDFSGFTNVSSVVSEAGFCNLQVNIDSCKAYTGVSLLSYAGERDVNSGDIVVTRTDPYNYDIVDYSYYGVTSLADRTRTGGASDGTAFAWAVDTTAYCAVGLEYKTPWINYWVSSTGSKTFDVYIANATADLSDTECWIEVEYLGTSGSTVQTIVTDRATDILSSGTAQADDTSSTWSTSTTYMQKLSTTATVSKTGLVRARVCFAAASLSDIYIDPKLNVS